MDIALLCVIIILTSGTDSFHLEAKAPYKEVGESILLRKLQASPPEDQKDDKTPTWNEILADALVNRIKIFSSNQEPESESNLEKGSFWTSLVSQMLQIYKTYIYDKIYKPNAPMNPDYENNLAKENKKDIDNVDVENKKHVVKDPKGEVEIIEPRYHGKLCEDCTGREEDVSTDIEGTTETVETVTCPDGLVPGVGGCVNAKSKFILSIPYQCPTGYRPDWLGYCRPSL